jgi:DNA polymerase III subunit chi
MVCACSTGLWRIILRVDFYHLTRAPIAAVLPMIAEKLLASGERLLVCAGDDGAALDKALWDYRTDSFLPHGLAGGEHDGAQPVLIGATLTATNGARNAAITDGVWRDEACDFDRAFYFFTSEIIDDARGAWRALAERAGVERHYWKQDDGGKWREGP